MNSTFTVLAAALLAIMAGCALDQTDRQSAPRARAPEPARVRIDETQAERLRAVMLPLLAHMDQPLSAREVKVGVWDDPRVNAANAGGGAIAPIASRLAISAYARSEESAADAHAVTLMKRAGYDGRRVMADALTWIARTEGESGGGFMDSHPATTDRIQALRELPQ